MADKGKWKRYFDGLPPWKRNALAGLALVLTAALMPALLTTFLSPATTLLSLSVFFAILAIYRLTQFLLKQCVKNPVVRELLILVILIGVMFSSWRAFQWYRFNLGGAVVTQYPEYGSTRTPAGIAAPEKRCLIWERWGVIHVWMETSEPDKCREIADHLRSVKKEHGIREKIVLTVVDWNKTKDCGDVVCRVRPFRFPGEKLSSFPPVFEETLE